MTDPDFGKENVNEQQANNESYEQSGVNIAPQKNYVTYIPYGLTPKTYEERSGIKKSALTIGLSLLSLLLITSVWAIVVFAVARFMGYDTESVREILTEPAGSQVVQIIISILMFTAPFILIFKINGYRISDLVPLEKPEKRDGPAMLLFGVSFCAFANIASSYTSNIFSSFGIDYSVDYGENPSGFFGFLLSVIATAIVPAFVEEFACRGLILGSLRKFGDGFAVLISSIVFGIMHGNFDQMPFAIMVGLVLGFIVVKTNSLWIAICVHFINNLVSVIFDYFLSSISNNLQNLLYAVYLMTALLLGIVAFLFSEKGKNFKFEPSTTESSLKQKCKWFIFSPTIIIFIIVCVLESFMYFN